MNVLKEPSVMEHACVQIPIISIQLMVNVCLENQRAVLATMITNAI
jgi:hypothetical protein